MRARRTIQSFRAQIGSLCRVEAFPNVLLLLILASMGCFAQAQENAATISPASHVDLFIGTGGDPDDGIDLYPGAVRSFGMVQLSPDTEDHDFGYHHIQARIKGFSMTHMSGVGCANEAMSSSPRPLAPSSHRLPTTRRPTRTSASPPHRATTALTCCSGASMPTSPQPNVPAWRASSFPPRQGGWMPRWPQINQYTNDMVGSPLSIALATAWLDGLHGFDIDTASEAMLKDATTTAPPGHKYIGEEGVAWINSNHYLPADKVD